MRMSFDLCSHGTLSKEHTQDTCIAIQLRQYSGINELVRMKEIPLRSVVTLPIRERKIELPESELELKGQPCHFLFDNKNTKEKFLAQFDDASVVVIPCGPFKGNQTTVLSRPTTFVGLLEVLKRVLRGELISDIRLNTLIIDNLSMFYWELKSVSKSDYRSFGLKEFYTISQLYLQLTGLIEQLIQKYKCNVVITSFDISVDKGYNSNFKAPDTFEGLSSLSYLPGSYLSKFENLGHIGETGVKFYNKKTEKWEIKLH